MPQGIGHIRIPVPTSAKRFLDSGFPGIIIDATGFVIISPATAAPVVAMNFLLVNELFVGFIAYCFIH